jgi:hypothetical protein
MGGGFELVWSSRHAFPVMLGSQKRGKKFPKKNFDEFC